MRKLQIVALLVALISFAISYFSYPLLPEKIITHWDAQGTANGWSGKGMTYFFPFLTLLILGLLIYLPKFDPMRKDAAGFQIYYDWLVLGTALFLTYMQALTTWINLGNSLNISFALAPAFAALFYGIGVLLEHAKPNWFIGIRTPWTLSSEKVWNKTHAMGAKIFKAGGIVILLGLILPNVAIPLILAFAIAGAVGTIVYSYVEYNKETKGKKN
jgi:uncharacterized membrane protein